MRVLLDHCVPRPFARELADHEVQTAHGMGWSHLKNGELLSAATAGGFDVVITVDRNLVYQQNVSALPIALIALHVIDSRAVTLAVLAPQERALLSKPLDSRAYAIGSPKP